MLKLLHAITLNPQQSMGAKIIFFSFYLLDFHSNITYLLNDLQHISWVTANLLTLNTSKTEFLVIGLKQQLAKIQNCTLNTTHSACNLV